MKTKSFFLIVFFFALVFTSCKKTPPPPLQLPHFPPLHVQTEKEYLKDLLPTLSQLKEGERITIKVDNRHVSLIESELYASLFPLEFTDLAEERYLVRYMFRSVVTRYPTFQLKVLNLEEYFLQREPGEKVWILKESPAGTPPFDQIPTYLIEGKNGWFWVLEQNAEEIPLRANWGK
jgi:hypothetical protein